MYLTQKRQLMNKQKDRYTPFTGKYRMPVNEFCEKYGLDLKLVMHRMNTLYWEDFDALVVPQQLGSLPADKIRRILELEKNGWTDDSIKKRIKVKNEVLQSVKQLDPYMKNIFLTMDHYFYLNPKKIDLAKVFQLNKN